MARVAKKLLFYANSCDIPYTASISDDVIFAHGGIGVVVGHDTVIGKGTKIEANVVIGGRKGIRANPIIGKNCMIGSGAVLLGPITIGDNCKIGANAVVLSSIPDGATAVGVPAHILCKEDHHTTVE